MSRRRLLAAAGATAAAFAATLPATAGADPIRLTEVDGVRFPDRAFVVTLPRDVAVDAARVRVLEDGNAVRFSLVPGAAAEKRTFGVILVIDASNSMRGEPIAAAMEAARSFAARRNANQAVGALVFNDEAHVLLAPTTDADEIERALAAPPVLGQGTHVYDGVGRALELLAEADIAAGSVVVLSDGADTGSRLGESGAIAAARDAHVRVFTIGLRSGSFREAPLSRLANDTHAAYSRADSASQLERIYGEIGSRLAREYLLRYRSLARPSAAVDVEVTIEGLGAASTTYEAPALEQTPLPPFHRSRLERFLASPASVAAVSLLFGLLAAAAVIVPLRGRRGTLVERMGEFVSVRQKQEKKRRQRPQLGERLAIETERSVGKRAFWARFKEDLEIAEISIPANRIAAAAALAALLSGSLLWLLAGPFFAAFGFAAPLGARALVKAKLARRRQAFGEQLPDNLQVLASAIRAGHSLAGALAVVVNDAPEPSQSEFRRVVADEQLGVPIDEALEKAARRMDNRDLDQVGLVAALQLETGGNTAEVLDRVVDTVRSRFELRRLVKTLTAQGRMARWIVSLLPAFLAAAISVMNPAYIRPLYTETVGKAAVFVAVVMVVSGSLVIKRIVNIRV